MLDMQGEPVTDWMPRGRQGKTGAHKTVFEVSNDQANST